MIEGGTWSMATKLYVGNLSYDVSEDQLRALFADMGVVVSAIVITDRQTGRSKGFGFVEMGSDEAAAKAIEELNSAEFEGRRLNVSEARPRGERAPVGQGFASPYRSRVY